MSNKGKKVYLGLSGGVDSSVSAVLLKEQDYDVTGVFIKVWQPEFVKCDWREDRFDAMRVCAKLEIPFKDLDLEEEYKKEVFDYMIKEYKEGRTPNPDVMCNKSIKFGGFLKFALKNGADFVATGHYCRKIQITKHKIQTNNKTQIHKQITNTNDQNSKQTFIHSIECMNEDCEYKLLAGVDSNKDQTYFLWTLKQEQLKHILFPVGDLVKPEVRKIAKKSDLLTAEKKDSQGLCFVGMVDMKDFLKKFLPEKKGDILNEKGEIIGEHDGAYYFTNGQRHGFLVTEKTPNDKPYFIVSKDVVKNTITVSQEFQKKVNFGKKKITIKDVNWTSGETPDLDKKYQARIRYRQELQNCKIHRNKASEDFVVVFDEPQRAVSEGQSLVIYDKKDCLGGGIIEY